MHDVSAAARDRRIVEALAPAVIAAGEAILSVRSRGVTVGTKADASPVTEADHAAEAVILAQLAKVAPGIPVIAEESCAAGVIPSVGAEFFLVDPLDGTKEFVGGGTDFTVNIGLVRNGVPVAGLVLAPASGAFYIGVAGDGAWSARVAGGILTDRRPIHVRAPASKPLDIVASKSHRTPETDAYIARYKVGELVAAGSSLKFCTIAAGEADLYPRMGTTMQWDTAAGDAVLRAAGGKVVTLDGAPLPYGPSGEAGAQAYRNPWFIAAGPIDLVV